LKILIISTVKPHAGSGIGLIEYAYQLKAHMEPLLSNEGSIEVLYALGRAERNNVRGLIVANTSFKKKIANIPANKYDIIHITDHEIGFAAKILKKHGNSAKVIITVHDLSRFENGLHRGISQNVYNKLVKGSIKDAINYSDFILCNSFQTYNTIEERFGKKRHMKVVLHGTNDKLLNAPLPKKPRGNVFVVGYIGALMKHKNVIFILNAAKSLRSDEYKFVLYGTGVDISMLQKFSEINRLDNLRLMGYLKEEYKLKAYDSFNAFVFPSLYEGLGNPILEAQARGLPVIIYKNAKIPKEVRKYCFGAESPEHMAQIIEDLKEKGYDEESRKKVTEYSRSFTWERCAKETLEVYKRAI